MSEVQEGHGSHELPIDPVAAQPPAASLPLRLEASLREDQFELLSKRLDPKKPKLLSPDSLLKIVQTLAILAAIGWPMHDYFAYKREAKSLELKNLEHDEHLKGLAVQLKGLAVQSATSLQFSRRATTEVIDVPGSDQNGTHLYRVKVGVQVTNNSQLYLECHGVRLRLLVGGLKEPTGAEFAMRTNSPGHKKGGIVWRSLLESKYHGIQAVMDWNPQKLGLDIPTGGPIEEVEGGLAFGQLSPSESDIGNDEFRIRAAKDSYAGFVFDYILESYAIEQSNGSPKKQNASWEQQHIELIRHLTEFGLQDEWGRPVETARAASGDGSAALPVRPASASTDPQAPRGAL